MKLHDLMTSDFISEGYTPDELIAFLLTFRYEYRKIENEKQQLGRTIDDLNKNNDEMITQLKIKNSKTVKRNSTLENHVARVNRGLTWRERFTGKIKY